MEIKKTALNIIALVLAASVILTVILGLTSRTEAVNVAVEDGVEQIDLNTIYLPNSAVEVKFSDVILSEHEENRKLIVSTQKGSVTTTLTARLIEKIDYDFMKKTQTVTYTGEGYFVVDLDQLTPANIIQDTENKTLTIKIGHAYLQDIVINPYNIKIGTVKESLLAKGDIQLTVADYNEIEKDIRSRLEAKFNTAANAQKADVIALKMVKDIYEPIIKAIDSRYTVIVEFK